jgi:predicted lipid carrier protein YhbT/chorismate mutase
MRPERRLGAARALIDRIDAAIIGLAAARRHAVALAARAKRAGAPRDPAREAAVHRHGRVVARDLGVPAAVADGLLDLLIDDACRQQGFDARPGPSSTEPLPDAPPMDTAWPHRLAALLPHPSVLRPVLGRIPPGLHAGLFARLAAHAVQAPLAAGDLGFLEGRALGIEATDLGLRWCFGLRAGRLVALQVPPEAEVRGTATDLLLLASRQEDADTLFFQRRLVLTGDTALGLEARNTLDRLEWETLPLGQRIVLHRAARHAALARAAWRARRQAEESRAAPVVPAQ